MIQLPHKKLGSTDLVVSTLGLGTTKLGRNTDVKYPTNFDLPTDKQAANLLSLAKDLNINLIDTAPAYGTAEQRLGNLLHKQRKDWIICSKAGEEYVDKQSKYSFTHKDIFASIHRSLKNLQTDYIDILLIHSDGNDEQIIHDFDVFNTLHQAKQHGLIRYYGMSTKTVAGGLLTLQHSDLAMVMYNPNNTEELPVIQQAAKDNKGIFIKKGFGSGHLNAQTCLDFIWQQPGVSSVIMGTINPEHLRENVEAVIRSLV